MYDVACPVSLTFTSCKCGFIGKRKIATVGIKLNNIVYDYEYFIIYYVSHSQCSIVILEIIIKCIKMINDNYYNKNNNSDHENNSENENSNSTTA